MSFPLGSLTGSEAPDAPANPAAGKTYQRSAKKKPAAAAQPRKPISPLWLVAAALLWGLVLLALLSHDKGDAAFSMSGGRELPHNWVGALGAWIADLLFFAFGFSAWWLMLVSLRAWLGALARSLRADPAPERNWRERVLFWGGLLLLMSASCALEWSRLYSWEIRLPGHAGGVLGYTLGPWGMKALGFAGSGVIWIVALVLGMALALRFSWLNMAEALGARLEQLRERSQERREIREDEKVGKRAKREREKVVEEERHVVEEHIPIVIEPPVVEVPKSTRVAKERQTPLFTELADTKLPQVDLLDAAPVRVETVTPESLEMTSRMIEKKLKDFGVEVRVVAASPGPVITRYEIEPATGVKGSQIVGLAKDLARSLSLTSIRVVETIPGKNYMALELPNARRQTIRLSEILG
ncbi:MAG: DNA translocase FtsK 4TM domain-containing protein, partial [Roseateles sp.]